MKSTRSFISDDIPQVAELHHRIFGSTRGSSRQPISSSELNAYADYFEKVFLKNPWINEGITSLVSETPTGRISGFLGIMPRRMSFFGKTINVAISSQFIVDPENKSTGAGIELMKRFLSGPQDLSLTDEANDISRKMWEVFGGVTVPVYGIHWTRLIRPTRYASSLVSHYFGKGGFLSNAFLKSTRPLSNLIDSIAARKLPKYFSQPKPKVSATRMTSEMLLSCLSEFSDSRSLWPEYDAQSLKWVLETIDTRSQSGTMRMHEIRNNGGALLGWYIYILEPGGEANVLQIMGRKNSIGSVIDHLFYDASSLGALSVTGRFDPMFIHSFSDKRCFLKCGYPWLLVNSRDNDLLRSISQGDALISKLEGEWCLHFR